MGGHRIEYGSGKGLGCVVVAKLMGRGGIAPLLALFSQKRLCKYTNLW